MYSAATAPGAQTALEVYEVVPLCKSCYVCLDMFNIADKMHLIIPVSLKQRTRHLPFFGVLCFVK